MNKEMFFKLFRNQKYVDQLKNIPQSFKVTHDEESNTSNITIYGVIGDSWFGDSFSASDIDSALNEAGDNDVTVNLNSPGGDAFDGIAIYNRLKRHKGKVTVHVDGWACSAASIIAMAGDEVIMETGSMMMIHEASTIAWGTKQDMRREANVLEQLEQGIVDIYQTKSTLEREDIVEKVDAETWMSARTAVEFGFADKATGIKVDKAKDDEVLNSAKSREDILNDLRKVLNKKPEEPVPTSTENDEGTGSFNFLKKWR